MTHSLFPSCPLFSLPAGEASVSLSDSLIPFHNSLLSSVLLRMMVQTVKEKIRRMKDRLIKREKEKEKGTEQ